MFSSEEILSQSFWGNTIESYCWFLGIIFFGIIFKRLLSRFLSYLLFAFFKKFAAEVKGEKFVELLIRPLEMLFLFVIFYLAVNTLDYPLNELVLKNKAFTYLDIIDVVFKLGMVISFTWIVLRIIDFVGLVMMYKASLTESKEDDQLIPFIKESAKVITTIIALFVLLGAVFQVNVASLIAGLGIGGLALALAAKESLENLISSFIIFMDKPFVVGDLVKIDGIEGSVEKVGFRSTRIKTLDKSIITLPNKKMVDGAMENLTLRSHRRVKFNLALSYDTDAETMRNITKDLRAYFEANLQIDTEESMVIFESFGDYSCNLMVLYFIEMIDYPTYLKAKEEVNYTILKIVADNGGKIALPTREVYTK